MAEAFKKQKEFFATGATRNAGWRKGQIMALMKVITEAAERISAAQAEDGVCPSSFQGAAGMLTGAAYFYMGSIEGWSAPKDLVDSLPAERRNGIECDWSCVMEPKGVVLNIAPWNAPILLSVLPCLGALAAGNCCVIKPPEHCPKTSALLVELIGGALAPEAVTVVEGGPEVCEGLIDLGFDHIMFTGGTEIGKLVMARAARTLTPVTLELGGKNPVMIDEMGDGMLNAVIAEIVSTKQYFSGEFCQCHDTLLVVDSMWDRFTAALEAGAYLHLCCCCLLLVLLLLLLSYALTPLPRLLLLISLCESCIVLSILIITVLLKHFIVHIPTTDAVCGSCDFTR